MGPHTDLQGSNIVLYHPQCCGCVLGRPHCGVTSLVEGPVHFANLLWSLGLPNGQKNNTNVKYLQSVEFPSSTSSAVCNNRLEAFEKSTKFIKFVIFSALDRFQ